MQPFIEGDLGPSSFQFKAGSVGFTRCVVLPEASATSFLLFVVGFVETSVFIFYFRFLSF